MRSVRLKEGSTVVENNQGETFFLISNRIIEGQMVI